MVQRQGPEMARRLHVLLLFFAFLVPQIGLWILESAQVAAGAAAQGFASKWSPYVFSDGTNIVWWKVVVLVSLAAGTTALAETLRRKAVKTHLGTV